MFNSSDLLSLSGDAIKLCKENEYKRLAELIHQSYLELIKIEASSRRAKSSVVIKAIQLLDLEMLKLTVEYKKVIRHFNMQEIPAIDHYIKELKHQRYQLVAEKNNFK